MWILGLKGLNTILERKGNPFMYLILINRTPFRYLVNSAFLLTAVNALSIEYVE